MTCKIAIQMYEVHANENGSRYHQAHLKPPEVTTSKPQHELTISWKIVAKGWACDSISNYQYNNIYITSQELFKWYIYNKFLLV